MYRSDRIIIRYFACFRNRFFPEINFSNLYRRTFYQVFRIFVKSSNLKNQGFFQNDLIIFRFYRHGIQEKLCTDATTMYIDGNQKNIRNFSSERSALYTFQDSKVLKVLAELPILSTFSPNLNIPLKSKIPNLVFFLEITYLTIIYIFPSFFLKNLQCFYCFMIDVKAIQHYNRKL